MEKEITPQMPQGGPAKTPGEQTLTDQIAARNQALGASPVPQGSAGARGLTGATIQASLGSFHEAVAKRMQESEAEVSAEEWTDFARSAFQNAQGIETPRPAPDAVIGAFPRFGAPDPDARLPSAVDVMAQMPPNTKIVSRAEFEKVGKELLKSDPDDFWEFYQEALDRVFGKAQG